MGSFTCNPAASTEPHRRPSLSFLRHLCWFAITLVTSHTYPSHVLPCKLYARHRRVRDTIACLPTTTEKQGRLTPSTCVPARLGIIINQSELSHPYYFQESMLTPSKRFLRRLAILSTLSARPFGQLSFLSQHPRTCSSSIRRVPRS